MCALPQVQMAHDCMIMPCVRMETHSCIQVYIMVIQTHFAYKHNYCTTFPFSGVLACTDVLLV